MTAQVLFNSVEIGIDRLAGDRLVFCNASRGVLVGDIPIVLPPERTVIEVLESVVIDDEVLEGCQRLLDQGFTLAMDDFTWFDGAERILEMASIVKVDLMLVQPRRAPIAPRTVPELRRDAAGREGRGQGAARALQGARLRILPGLPAVAARRSSRAGATASRARASPSCASPSTCGTPTPVSTPSSDSCGRTLRSASRSSRWPASGARTGCGARCGRSTRR